MADLHWPLYALRICTPRIELRYTDDELARTLAELAIEGIHPPEAMPFSIPWSRQEPDVMRREYPKHVWASRARTCAEDWSLKLAVLLDGEVVGVQDAFAKHFPVTRQFETGSWLGQRFQGRGIGAEMRAAVLHLGFVGLGAVRAVSGAFQDNPASAALSHKLGYTDNGWSIENREGTPVRLQHFALLREEWEPRRRDDITISGLEPCLGILGLDG